MLAHRNFIEVKLLMMYHYCIMDIFPWTWAEICDKSTIFLDPDLGFVPLMATRHGGATTVDGLGVAE